ncbi:hypothetical protein VTL71DRAFT_10095 [Oculimacula yallundae]|uniref:Receptor L-domain domain-containing protein n=1 Tax=Oculimacula yallundae TaxID=86028 RepID=A0ABR4BQI0_9HELO
MGLLFKLVCCYFMIERAVAQDTTNPCVPSFAGDLGIYIRNQTEVERILGCTTITGNLEIFTKDTVTLPNLKLVEGDLRFGDRVLDRRQLEPLPSLNQSFILPSLEQVTGSLNIESSTLRNLALPVLARANSIIIQASILQSWIKANSLEFGYLTVDKHNISSLSFENLNNVTSVIVNFVAEGSLYLNGTMGNDPERAGVRVKGAGNSSFTSDLQNTNATSFNLRGFTNIAINTENLGTLSIADTPGLESIHLPSLVRMTGNSTGGRGIFITDNEDLKEVSFPKLNSIDGELRVIGNERLTEFGEGFSSLESISFYLALIGNFTSFHFPKPVTVGKTTMISSSVNTFNCNTISESFVNGTVVNCSPYTPPPTISPPEKHSKDTLSKGVKIGLSVAIAVLFILSFFLGCGFCLLRSHRNGDGTGRLAIIASKLARLLGKENSHNKPPPYPLGDYPRGAHGGRAGEDPPSYEARPSSTATTVVPNSRSREVSRLETGTGLGRSLTGDRGRERSVSPMSAVSVERPSDAYQPPQGNARVSLPPDYRP